MNLGVFLAIGESFADFSTKGQDELIKEYLLKNYSNNFGEVFVFSYGNESFTFWKNVHILPNKWRLHRFIYWFFIPFIYAREIRSCAVLRGLQITGGLPGIVSKLIWRKPLVVNFGYDYRSFARIENKLVQVLLFQLIQKPVLAFTDKIIVTAGYLYKYIPEEFHFKVTHIPNGVDTTKFFPISKPVSKKITLIYYGRFESQKNLQNLIKAIALLQSDKVKLLLIGKGSEAEKLTQLADQNHVRLQILPPVKHTLLPNYLAQADIFILPSLIEGQPKALLEAMSCGLPVIASNIPAHREIIENNKNGILCGIEPQQIVKSIEKLILNPALRSTIDKNARITIETNFNKRKLNTEEIELLKKVAFPQKK